MFTSNGIDELAHRSVELRGISLIVATLGERDLHPLLDSLEAQSCDKYECIVIDQSLTRQAEKIVNEYRNIKYIHSSRRGNSLNRNIGILHASLPIFGFPDDDCFYNTDVIEKVLNAFTDCSQDTAAISGIWMDSLTGTLAMGSKKKKYANRINIWSCITNLTIFLRAEIVRGVNGYDERFGLGSNLFEGGEETDLVLKVLDSGRKILYVPDIKIWHRQDRYVLNNPQKQWGYEESWGALFRKWSARPIIDFVFFLFFCRSLLGAIIWLFRGNYRNSRLYLRKNSARLAGWFKYAKIDYCEKKNNEKRG